MALWVCVSRLAVRDAELWPRSGVRRWTQGGLSAARSSRPGRVVLPQPTRGKENMVPSEPDSLTRDEQSLTYAITTWRYLRGAIIVLVVGLAVSVVFELLKSPMGCLRRRSAPTTTRPCTAIASLRSSESECASSA